MGMVMDGKILSAEQAEAVLADPDLIEDLVYGENHEIEYPDLGELSIEELGDSLFYDPSRLDLDKAWHGVHFMLTGTEWDASQPLGLAILGGQPVGEDNGYGPARLLDPEQVQFVAGALIAVDTDELRKRFDPAEFAEHDIYPSDVWNQDGILEGYLMPSLQQLIAFYVMAASTRSAVLLLIT